MSIRVELTYDMGKALGMSKFEVESAATVSEVIEETRKRFPGGGDQFAHKSEAVFRRPAVFVFTVIGQRVQELGHEHAVACG